jgi:hypothetical protein
MPVVISLSIGAGIISVRKMSWMTFTLYLPQYLGDWISSRRTHGETLGMGDSGFAVSDMIGLIVGRSDKRHLQLIMSIVRGTGVGCAVDLVHGANVT